MTEPETLDDDATFIHEPHPNTRLRRRTVTGEVKVEAKADDFVDADPDVIGVRELGLPAGMNGDTREMLDAARRSVSDMLSRLHPGTVQIIVGELLANMPNDRASVLLLNRACELDSGSREDMAEVLVAMLGNELAAVKKAADEARDKQRNIECSLLRIVGPYIGQIGEGS
jgi:hypothetical protein